GAARDTFSHVERTLLTEMNAVTDNPSIFSDTDDVISAGNFHGEPVAFVADFLGIACAEIGNISERRINRMVDGSYNHLPMFLVKVPGINSGLMIPQYTAAALVSENKGLAFPNSVDSITTSANQEDHNSMGTIAARNAMSIVENVEGVLAIELITAAQALEFSPDKQLGTGTQAARDAVREAIPEWVDDRYMYPDLEAGRHLATSGEVLEAVRNAGVTLS
ncbi:MAG: aromatic amino acid lyase, partial [Holophagales bacterium]|nr:aromatic amino acid lyase [Holophagales bacterium]